MVWDCLIAWVVLLCTVVGWSMGLVKSWTVPVAMVITTFISQNIYIDLSTVLVETLHLEPTLAVFLGYSFTWLWLVQYTDALLASLFIHGCRTDSDPVLISKIGGACIGFSKGMACFVFAAMVAYAQNHVPEPSEVSWQSQWILRLANGSFLLPRIHQVACNLDKPLGKYILSESSPRIHATFEINGPFSSLAKSQERKGLEFAKSWKRFEQDMGNVLP